MCAATRTKPAHLAAQVCVLERGTVCPVLRVRQAGASIGSARACFKAPPSRACSSFLAHTPPRPPFLASLTPPHSPHSQLAVGALGLAVAYSTTRPRASPPAPPPPPATTSLGAEAAATTGRVWGLTKKE